MNASSPKNNTALYRINNRYLEAFDYLTSPDCDIDITTVTDTLEAIEGEFEEKSINLIKYTESINATIDGIKKAELAMKARRTALEKRIEWLKSYLKENMESSEITVIECPYFTIKIATNPPALIIHNEEIIPNQYKSVIPVTKIHTTDIKKALKEGKKIPGASLKSGTRLSIK